LHVLVAVRRLTRRSFSEGGLLLHSLFSSLVAFSPSSFVKIRQLPTLPQGYDREKRDLTLGYNYITLSAFLWLKQIYSLFKND
jgi:hypothetical protein